MERAIRIGLESTKIGLSEACQEWFVKAYPQGIIYEYVVTEPFDLKSMGKDFVDILCPLCIPYRIPLNFDGEVSFQMYDTSTETEG